MTGLESYPSIEYICLGDVVHVRQDPSTTHQINLGLYEELPDASKALRVCSEPGRLECGGLEGLIRPRGARQAVINEN